MKKLLSLILIFVMLVSSFAAYAQEAVPVPDGLRSSNILLIDATSDRIIYEKNSKGQMAPGGIAKILTGVIAIDFVASLDENVTANAKAVTTFDFTNNNMGVLPGETLTVRQLLYGMLIYDAGEAANVLAVYCGDSIEKFVEKMNKKAGELGCANTRFTNPSGVADANQYTTLEDAAKIVKYAMEFEPFCEIVAAKSYTIAPTNKYRETRYLNNTNKFISTSSTNAYYNKFVTGVKTSYVSNSDCGLVVTYQNGNTNLMCLTAGAPYSDGINYANEDCTKLIEYGKNYHTSVKIAAADEILAEVKVRGGREDNKVLLVAPQDFYINLPKGYDEAMLEKEIETSKKIKAPISKGDALGQLTVLYNGEKYGSVILTADQSISSAPIKAFFQSIGAIFTSWIFILIVVLIIVLFAAYTVALNKAKRKRKYVSRFNDYI